MARSLLTGRILLGGMSRSGDAFLIRQADGEWRFHTIWGLVLHVSDERVAQFSAEHDLIPVEKRFRTFAAVRRYITRHAIPTRLDHVALSDYSEEDIEDALDETLTASSPEDRAEATELLQQVLDEASSDVLAPKLRERVSARITELGENHR